MTSHYALFKGALSKPRHFWVHRFVVVFEVVEVFGVVLDDFKVLEVFV
jgi:hypothetical protein